MNPLQLAYDELKAKHVRLEQAPGEYRVDFAEGAPSTEYRTDDLTDAPRRGREMAAQHSSSNWLASA
jgi:hypothetical protein